MTGSSSSPLLLRQALSVLFMSLLVAPHLTLADDVVCPANSSVRCQRTCRATCEELNQINIPVCTKICTTGCECNEGYIFKTSEKKECVRYDQCQVKCPDLMHYEPCPPNPHATCEKPEETSSTPQRCDPWCVCNKGYVYRSNQDRTCVPKEKCP
ncbi:serine protease inhibitor swm-1-like [Pleurodeles waltl]|uniref:serine protease inhibitor swm-1-like n=1 Tax=Pleurodeles waltl TaxID=8319 RepID=UPI0037095F7B